VSAIDSDPDLSAELQRLVDSLAERQVPAKEALGILEARVEEIASEHGVDPVTRAELKTRYKAARADEAYERNYWLDVALSSNAYAYAEEGVSKPEALRRLAADNASRKEANPHLSLLPTKALLRHWNAAVEAKALADAERVRTFEMASAAARSTLPESVRTELESNPELADRVGRLALDEKAREIGRRIAAGKRPSFESRLLSPSALAALPTPEDLVPGVLTRGTTAMLFAPPAYAKSLLALGLGYAISTGHEWFGRPVHQGRTLYIAAEGVQGLAARTKALEMAWGVPLEEDSFFVFPDVVDFGNASDVAEIAAFVSENKIDFVVGDTLARLAPGLEENSSTAMGVIVSAADTVRKAREGCTILLVHHAGKGGDLRGSSALLGGMDTVLRLSGDGGILTLESVKNKDTTTGRIIDLKVMPVPDSDSVVLTSAAGDSWEAELSAMAPRVEEAFGIFKAAFSATGTTKTAWRDLLVDAGMPRKTAYTAINKLVNTGRVLQDGSLFSLAPGLDANTSPLSLNL